MTLVGLEESSHGFGMMLSVQSQQQQFHVAAHRGNVIVTANNNNNNGAESKQQQQQSQAQQKRKMYAQTTPQYSAGGQQPASVARRNARERNRVKQVNNGFATLRQHIPQSLAQALGGNTAGTHGGARAGSKKLSKVETLRMAVEYIRNLKQLLDENDSEAGGSSCASSSGSPPPPTPSHSSQSLGSPVMEMHHHQRLHQHPEIKFELKCESSDDDVQDLVNHHHSHHHHHQHHQQLQYQQLQPVGHQQQSSPVYTPAPCSEASSSPTPSFVSEASSTGGSQGYGNFSGPIYTSHNDGYDNYEPMSPEDEELLDYISLWQQGQ